MTAERWSQVREWSFEVWNELWGLTYPKDYMAMYNASAAAIKSVDKRLKVGGPTTDRTRCAAGARVRSELQSYRTNVLVPTRGGRCAIAGTLAISRRGARRRRSRSTS